MQNTRGRKTATTTSTERGVSYDAIRGAWIAQHRYQYEVWSRRFPTEEAATEAVKARRLGVLGYYYRPGDAA